MKELKEVNDDLQISDENELKVGAALTELTKVYKISRKIER